MLYENLCGGFKMRRNRKRTQRSTPLQQWDCGEERHTASGEHWITSRWRRRILEYKFGVVKRKENQAGVNRGAKSGRIRTAKGVLTVLRGKQPATRRGFCCKPDRAQGSRGLDDSQLRGGQEKAMGKRDGALEVRPEKGA